MLKYYDAAATTPTHPLVVEAMLPYFTEIYGNPSSSHEFGKHARAAVEKAREQVAQLLNVFPDEVIFTSGATEAINLGIYGYWMANRSKGNHIITVVTEHAAVLNTCANLEQFGVEVTRLLVNRFGQIDHDELESCIRKDTLLVAVMHVNNETGLILDVQEIGKTCARHSIAFFTDGTQAVGHISTDYSAEEISMIAISAHKFQGPKGVGALIKKRGVNLSPILFGGGQEGGLRPGSLSTPLIVGFGEISSITSQNFNKLQTSLLDESNVLLNQISIQGQLQEYIPANLRSPHILPFLTREGTSDTFLKRIDTLTNYALSTSSACKSGLIEPSYVVTACSGIEDAKRFVRFSITAEWTS
jgi:cysteine desulfurase